jgi:hypothetical protein
METDVFVVHSKRDSSQAKTYEYLLGEAARCDVKVLEYDDWEWAREGELILDLHKKAYREPDLYEQLPPRINKEDLTRIWEQTGVLIVLTPARPKIGKGVRYELDKLREFYATHRRRRTPIPLVFNVGHERPPSFSGIPIAQSVSVVDVDHLPSFVNAFALLALTWLIYEIERFRGLSGYLLAQSQEFQEPLSLLLDGRKNRLPVETDAENIQPPDPAALSKGPKLIRFWEKKARKVLMWFSHADDCPYVHAARTFIMVTQARIQGLSLT